nr:MAG TPA: hypothetical protein [Caudoviricetes sp.]
MGLFGFNPFIYKAFKAFIYFPILVPPILLFILAKLQSRRYLQRKQKATTKPLGAN